MSIPLPNLLLNANQFNYVDLILIFLLIICLGFSAFFSSSETAISVSSQIRIKKYADEKKKGALKVLYIMEHYNKALTTILVGNNFVNIASTTICAVIFGKFILNPTLANILNTVIMTIIVLIFGEILPKNMAKLNPEKFALKISGFLLFIMKLLTPITFIFLSMQKLVLKNYKHQENPTVTEDELETIIDTMEEEGVLDEKDADIFQGVMDLEDQEIYNIMTPRVDMVCIEVSANIKELQKKFLTSGYSRIPVYKNDKDHMIGIVHIKDFINKKLNSETFKIQDIMTEPIFVAENMKAKDLLRKMQIEKKHMAVVIDEHGGTSGIVTLEDMLEEILGEIYDEHDNDIETNYITALDDNTYEVNPEIDLDDLFEFLDIDYMPETEYTNLGGYLYELAENLPEVNQELEDNISIQEMGEHGTIAEKNIKLIFIITEIEDRRIKKVTLKVVKNKILPENN